VIGPSFRIDDPEPVEGRTASSSPLLVSLHFMRAALRRQWKIWIGFALVGALLGMAWNVVMPSKSTGTVTLLLAHDPTIDPAQAMATDVSLLSTRAVAGRVLDQLDLQSTTEGLQESITAVPSTSSVLVLTIPAADDQAAVDNARALANVYLDFRTEHLRAQSAALVAGYEERVASLENEVERLTTRYDTLTSSVPEAEAEATDVLTQRSQINVEISRLRQIIEDSTLQTNSIIAASHILDPPSAEPKARTISIGLNIASGLIGGLAVGIGLVLFRALTSDRLRRREDVALALDSPVRVSVGRIRQPRWRTLVHRGSSRERDLQILVRELESAVSPTRGRPQRLGLAVVDDSTDAEYVLAALGAQLAQGGQWVFLVDLTEAGHLQQAVSEELDRRQPPHGPAVLPAVLRPEGLPSLARGPIGAVPGRPNDLPEDDPRRPAWDAADVVLALAEIKPAGGVENLGSWVDQVVLLVTAGRSTAERLRTSAELIRAAGMRLLFAVMTDADKADESLGLREAPDDGWPGARSASL
jgi:capsular polysaccharide biosynthesis protein